MFSQHGRTWRAWIRSVGYVSTLRVGDFCFPSFLLFLPGFSSFLSSFLFGSSVVFSFFFLFVGLGPVVCDRLLGEERKTRRRRGEQSRIEQEWKKNRR